MAPHDFRHQSSRLRQFGGRAAHPLWSTGKRHVRPSRGCTRAQGPARREAAAGTSSAMPVASRVRLLRSRPPFAWSMERPGHHRNEVIFEPTRLSCYSGKPFKVCMERRRGGIVMDGPAGESSRLPTLVEAFRRKHKIISSARPFSSQALDEMAGDARRGVSTRSGLDADMCGDGRLDRRHRVASPGSRKLGSRKRGRGKLGRGKLGMSAGG